MIKPLNMHYSFENPASIYDEEALTALELAGMQAAKINEIIKDQNSLRQETDDHLEGQDRTFEQRMNAQDNAITKMNNETMPAKVVSEVNRHIHAGDFDTAIDTYAGGLKEQVNNLAQAVTPGSTSGDVELIDGRLAWDGVRYDNIGQHLRQETRDLEKSINYSAIGYSVKHLFWEQGGFSATTGAVAVDLNVIRTPEYFNVTDFKDVVFNYPNGYDLYTFEYDGSKNFLRYSYVTNGCGIRVRTDCIYVRLFFAKTVREPLTVDGKNLITIYHPEPTTQNDFSRKMRNLVVREKKAVDDGDQYPTNTGQGGNRYFLNGLAGSLGSTLIPAESYLKNISFCVTAGSHSTIVVEIWDYVDGQYKLSATKTVSDIMGDITIPLSHYCGYPTAVSIRSDTNCIRYKTVEGRWFLCSGDIESSTLTVNQVTTFTGMTLGAVVEYEQFMLNNKVPKIIEIGEGRDFEEIQDAINTLDYEGVYTLIVHPKNAPYKPFSMIRASFDNVYHWSERPVRNVSIIGLDRTKCIVKSDTGDYDRPASELLCNGTIENITFIMTHENQTTTAKQGGYASHIDANTQDEIGYHMVIKNCHFESTTGPGVGVGLHRNTRLEFKGCTFESTADPDYIPHTGYGNNANGGAFFAHSSTLEGVTNQHLILDNCRMRTKHGTKCLWLGDARTNKNVAHECVVSAFHNIMQNDNPDGVLVSFDAGLQLDAMSFGNNSSRINASVVE